jgi:hypothetical protein
MDVMEFRRLALLCTAFALLANTGCSKTLPEEGPLTATSQTVYVSGEYRRVALDTIERMTIEGDKLVLHGPSATLEVELPPAADPAQKNKGWALVTEGETEAGIRTLTFTQETSLDDFTISVPASEGPVSYGSLGGRDGNDVLLFAYGSASRSFWGWVTISSHSRAAQ